MSSFFENLESFGEAPALVDLASGETVTFVQLRDVLRRNEPADAGKPTLVGGSPDFGSALRLLSVLAAGRVVVPLGTRLPAAEVRRRGALIVSAGSPCGAADGGTILFTSGSSGLPKAVFHGLEAHVANAQAARERIPLGEGCGWLLSLPLNHVSGLAVLVRCLTSGAAVVFPDRSRPLGEAIASPFVTHLSVVAVQLQRMLEAGVDFSSLKAVLGGGGPFSTSLVEAAVRAGLPLHLTYGMTEAASQIATSEKIVSGGVRHVGHVLKGGDISLDGGVEIRVKGPSLTRMVLEGGEWRSPLDVEGWFSTGDVGAFCPSGELLVIGRMDRMLISGGENIHPEAIENLLHGVTGVRRVAVVAVPDREYGQRPWAFVDGEVQESLLREHLENYLERFAIPDRFILWPKEVPCGSPKIDYPALSSIARAMSVGG